ncbi:MAG: hypothetical protein ABIW79_09900 [Gemmatimonas sp.]
MQYTIRSIPVFLDRVLRRRARESGASLNDVVLEALARDAGVAASRMPRRSLTDLAGQWQEDPAFDEAVREQNAIDERLWK